MTHRWRKIRGLGWLEWQTIAQSVVLLPACAVNLRRNGLRQTLEKLRQGRRARSGLPPGEEEAIARRLARSVNIAAGYGPYRANCLKRSLVLARLLERRGIEYELRLGAATGASEFSAHAWVEHHGVPINDDAAIGQRFTSFRADAGRDS